MSAGGTDFDYDDDDDSRMDAGGVEREGDPGLDGPEERPKGIRNWLSGRRGWVMLVGITVVQALFATVMIFLRSNAKPVEAESRRAIQALAVEMLGHEVAIRQIYQALPGHGGKLMTIGLDIVLVLGQLPEERVEGAPRPTGQEMAVFIQAIRDMEDRIRSQVNILLQKIPAKDYGTVDAYKTIKDSVRQYINDSLDGLDFGEHLRPGIGKRRVTEVLLPMFVRMTN